MDGCIMYVSIDVCKYGWMDGRTDGWMDVMLWYVVSCHVMSCYVLSCPVLSRRVISCCVCMFVCTYVHFCV